MPAPTSSERILILEDDTEFARLMAEVLKELGQVLIISNPENLETAIAELRPTLIIVDHHLNHPHMDGIKATQMIKQNPRSALIPVLLLSGESGMEVIERAFKSGIEDYVLKPVLPRFLLAKVENLLFQSRRKLQAQSLSGLPGNAAIEAEFALRLAKKKPFSAAYTDIDNFKPFNDEKGVKQGDLAIGLLAQILYTLRQKNSREQLFVGHIGGDDFLLFGNRTNIRRTVRQLRQKFQEQAGLFFSEQEIKQGYYHGTDRQGKPAKFPLLDISTAIVDGICPQSIANFQLLTEIAAKIKKAAKKSRNHIAAADARSLSVFKNEPKLQNKQKEPKARQYLRK